MAKRFVKFESILEGYFKPEGTLGTHHCVVVFQGDKKIAIGSVSGNITLKQGDTLGYDLGTVWLVPSADSYKDPIRKVLAKAHVSQRALTYSDAPVEYLESWDEGFPYYDNSTGDESVVLGDFNKEIQKKPWNCWQKSKVSGGKIVIIKKVVSRDQTIIRRRRIEKIIVRSGYDWEKVAKFLEEEFSNPSITLNPRVGEFEEMRIIRDWY